MRQEGVDGHSRQSAPDPSVPGLPGLVGDRAGRTTFASASEKETGCMLQIRRVCLDDFGLTTAPEFSEQSKLSARLLLEEKQTNFTTLMLNSLVQCVAELLVSC